MKLLQKLGFLAAACALLVATFAMIRPHAVRAAVATLVEDVNGPALQPFTQECLNSPFLANGNGSCVLAAVPAGKRWVIETVSGRLTLSSGTKPLSIDLQACTGGKVTDNFFPAAFQGNSSFFTGDYYVTNQKVLLYADDTSGCAAPLFSMTVGNASSSANLTGSIADLSVSGYLVNLP